MTKKNYGMAPMDLIHSARLREMCKLLGGQEPTASVLDVSKASLSRACSSTGARKAPKLSRKLREKLRNGWKAWNAEQEAKELRKKDGTMRKPQAVQGAVPLPPLRNDSKLDRIERKIDALLAACNINPESI